MSTLRRFKARSSLSAQPSSGRCNPPEITLLLAASGATLAEANTLSVGAVIDWELLLELAEWHGLAPLLWQYLERSEFPVPDVVRSRLRESTRQSALHNLLLASELVRISRLLRLREIEHLAYKGPLLASALYSGLGERISSDLDILVPRHKLQRACEALAELGFVDKNGFSPAQRDAAFRFGFEHTFTRPGGIDLDLHWRLVPAFVSPSFDEEGMWSRAVWLELSGRRVPALCPEDTLIALCLHAGQHEWAHLSMFSDLQRLLLRYPGLRWEMFFRHLGDASTRRIVFVSLLLLERHWNPAFPAEVVEMLHSDIHAQRLAAYVEQEIWPAGEFALPPHASLKWLRRRTEGQSLGSRIRYVAGIALKPTVAD